MANCTPSPIVPRVPCNACADADTVLHMNDGQLTQLAKSTFDNNADLLQCALDLCLGNNTSEELTVAAPAARLFGNSNIDSTAQAVDATLADGTFVGQEKYFLMTEASNSSTVTVATHATSNPEVFTFAATTAYLLLKWSGTEWVTIAATATV